MQRLALYRSDPSSASALGNDAMDIDSDVKDRDGEKAERRRYVEGVARRVVREKVGSGIGGEGEGLGTGRDGPEVAGLEEMVGEGVLKGDTGRK